MADGRGFRTIIADALADDIPVLVGLNTLNLQPFKDFVGDVAQQIDPNPTALLSWCKTAMRDLQTAA